MFSRILFSTLAAATLVTAAPALAADGAASKDPCTCCSDGSIHDIDHPAREAQKQKGSAERTTQQRTADEDPFVRNQSFGG
jgi:hypothetical protein